MGELMDTFGGALQAHASTQGDAVAMRFDGRISSYALFNAHANQVANALIAGPDTGQPDCLSRQE